MPMAAHIHVNWSEKDRYKNPSALYT
uniref:Uncharacterized protein n=1 Tax=Rhizophora mucronata TaxID=61149 RepID=A0A2P2QRC5_RHIMU